MNIAEYSSAILILDWLRITMVHAEGLIGGTGWDDVCM